MVAFIRQCQYNFDMAPDKMQLQNMCKKGHESFKEYAQRWRTWQLKVAPQWQKKMMTIIVDTIPVFYYEKMVGYAPSELCGYGLCQWKDRSGSEKRQIWSSCFDKCKKKLGQMKRVRMRDKPMLWLPFLYGQTSHQPNNVITQPITTLLLTHHPVIHKGHH